MFVVPIANYACAVAVDTINLTPNEDYTVPYNLNENITYYCEVDSGQGVVWTIVTPRPRPDIQIQTNQSKMEYADNYGLFVEDIQTNESRLHVTQMARDMFCERLGSPRLEIGCFPLSPVEIFPTHTITTFGTGYIIKLRGINLYTS